MAQAQARYISMDGKLVPHDEARIHVLTPAVKYGASVFEGICAYEGKGGVTVFRLDEHLVRLQHSMRILRYDREYDLDHLRRIVLDCIKANELTGDAHIRLQAHVLGEGLMGATGPVGLSCTVAPRAARGLDDRRIKGVVSSWRRIDDSSMPPRVKAAANYHNGRLGVILARAQGYDEAIFLTGAGKVAEGAGACIVMVRDGVPYTPTVTSGILESVTRDSLIKLFASEIGRPVVEREIDRTELYIADEVFFCGSAYEVSPIVSIDGLPVGRGEIGPVTREAWDAYEDAVRARNQGRMGWLTSLSGG